jgi:hypothetical protein
MGGEGSEAPTDSPAGTLAEIVAVDFADACPDVFSVLGPCSGRPLFLSPLSSEPGGPLFFSLLLSEPAGAFFFGSAFFEPVGADLPLDTFGVVRIFIVVFIFEAELPP